MQIRSDIRLIIARGIFTLFVLMQLNVVVFRHAHKLSSGKVITHAHPYKPVGNAPYQPHHHSDNELFLLDLTSNGCFTVAPVFADLLLSVVFLLPQRAVFFHYLPFSLQRLRSSLSLRGPPVLS